MTCGVCARTIQPSALYCEGCGSAVPERAATPSEPVVALGGSDPDPKAVPANASETQPSPVEPALRSIPEIPFGADHPSTGLWPQLWRRLHEIDAEVPLATVVAVAAQLPTDSEIQRVGLLAPTSRAQQSRGSDPVLMVLTEWHLVFGPLLEGLLSLWPQRQWRRGELLAIPRAQLVQAHAASGEVTLMILLDAHSEAGRSTRVVSLPLTPMTANVGLTLEWVAQSVVPAAHAPAAGLGAVSAQGGTMSVGTWAADPTGRSGLRWWDGQRWTSHTRD